MTLPDNMPGLSKRRYRALEAARCIADLAKCGDKARKEYEAREAARGADLQEEQGSRPKRKRARRGAGAGPVAAADRADWPFTDETVEIFYQMVKRRVTPRMMAQEARQAGDPRAAPRDYHGDKA